MIEILKVIFIWIVRIQELAIEGHLNMKDGINAHNYMPKQILLILFPNIYQIIIPWPGHSSILETRVVSISHIDHSNPEQVPDSEILNILHYFL